MLPGTANAIAPALTTLFNESLRQGQIPKDWKISNITPIPKSGKPFLVNNYRPISLLSLVSKILERIVHSNLMDYLTRHNHISPNQLASDRDHPPKKPSSKLPTAGTAISSTTSKLELSSSTSVRPLTRFLTFVFSQPWLMSASVVIS